MAKCRVCCAYRKTCTDRYAETCIPYGFSPRDDCRLQVVDRFTLDPRTEVCPAQVRDVWEGTGQPGRQLVFTQVYYPHPPWPPRPDTNNPGAKANYRGGDLEASAGASGITVLRDDVEASVLRLQLDPGRAEWVVFNPGGSRLSLDSLDTDATYGYIDRTKDTMRGSAGR